MNKDAAETIALQALAWIAADDDILPVFMGASGISVDDMKMRTQDPEFLASILDFLLMDDTWIVGFCDSRGLAYDRVLQARRGLPGGQEINWT